ncbi:uncharacterized protein HMPREF1541_10060 [Cyphellophora europaea CBS 101466]|uniref:GDP/GTP exchange factor Sec2 N-terminal domain-containing protein n=1 Tax=Cyphellophora europaea (strain CBS 101466) TaxID=1220924 RepID=W2SAX9_CYPE1|nr:uncharacterized protein HMPREF1541_10060 [Cyphellophora europaea CBS 101466]ETN45183.1 hypothetical protein HMPREF1541_10060 [Cyphellophora europaea CBS 101466]
MSAFHSNHFSQPQTSSPPRSQPPSPAISRKPLPAAPSHSHSTSTSCPSCGHAFASSAAEDAQRMINDLQAQVKLLNSKAAAAVDKLADYEDEVRALRAERQQREVAESIVQQQQQQNPNLPPPPLSDGRNMPPQQSRLSSLRSLLGGQRRNPSDSGIDGSFTLPGYAQTSFGSASQPHLPFSSSEPTLHSLQSDLASEREMRLKAETSLSQTQLELEDLTAQLFGQANEMVAEERRARSKLEERVRILERREKEKGERLKRLEGRVERVERVRAMVG